MNTKLLHKVTSLKFVKGLISIVFGIFSANLVSIIVDNGTCGKTDDVIRNSGILLGAVIIYEGIMLLSNIVIERLNEIKTQEFRIKVYEGFLDKPVCELNTLKTGSLINNFTDDIGEIIKLYTESLPNLLSNSIMVIAYLTFIGILDFKIALILLSIGIIQIIPPIVVKRFMEVNYDETEKIESEITDYIIEGFHGRSTIKLLNLKDYYLEGIKKFHCRYLKIGSKSELTGKGETAMFNAVSAILKFGTYGLLGWFLVKGYLTLSIVTKVIVLSGSLYEAMNGVFTTIPLIGVANKARERAVVLYSKKLDNNKNEVKTSLYDDNKFENSNKIIEVKGLSFSYDKEHIVLNDVNFNVNKGDKVVIQGENGSGKSTLFNTLLGINMDYDGEVLVEGENLRNIDFQGYFRRISTIAQDDYGFSMSPREFLEMLSQSDNLNLEEALKLTDELGMKREALDNEKIGEISGGEKKKLYLIASLLKKSKILFLDEPGNCLDVKGKEVLRKRLLTSGQTIILITHDPFFEEIANLKLRVKDGKVEVNYLPNREVI